MVLLAGQLLQEIRGACAVFVCAMVFVVGKQQVCYGVYYYKSAAPFAYSGRREPVVNVFKRGGIQYAAQCAVPFVEQSCHLPDAHVWEVLRPGAQVVPVECCHRFRQSEFVAQELVFCVHPFLQVFVCYLVYKSGKSQEHAFYLKQVVAVLACRIQRDTLCPHLEDVAVKAETEVACQGYERCLFPVAAAFLQYIQYPFGACLHSFCQKGIKP